MGSEMLELERTEFDFNPEKVTRLEDTLQVTRWDGAQFYLVGDTESFDLWKADSEEKCFRFTDAVWIETNKTTLMMEVAMMVQRAIA